MDTAACFRVIVEEKLHLLNKLYPGNTIKPKMHYLIHYATQMERFGPVIHTWTMRHEAKLSFIKKASRRGNFKNICKSITRHHQLWMCYHLSVEPHLLYTVPECGPSTKESNLLSQPENTQSKIQHSTDANYFSIVKHHNWLQIQSTRFTHGRGILLERSILSPTFGKICDILSCESKHFLMVEVFTTDFFCSHYNAYVVLSSAQMRLVYAPKN